MMQLLLAQGGQGGFDWAKVLPIIGIIVFAVGSWVARQIASRQAGNAPGPPVAPRQQAPRPPQRAAGRPAAARAGGEPRDEVEEFLRRVADRRAGAKPREVEVLEPQQPRPSRLQPQPAAPVEAEVIEVERTLAKEPVFRGSSVSQHVDVHLGEDDVDDVRRLNEPRLSSSPDLSDDVMEKHIHEVFDHQVGSLAQSPIGGQPAEPPAPKTGRRKGELPQTAAAGLAALLADTHSLRRAIVINEILTRPKHDW